MRRLTVLFAALALALAACGTGADEASDEPITTEEPAATETAPTMDETPTETEATPSETGTAAVALTQTCEAPAYTVDYPEGWNTNSGEVTGQCRVFDPGEIDVERGTDLSLAYAAQLWIDEVDFDTVSGVNENDELLDSEQLSVDGHDAVRLTYEAGGQGLVPGGTSVTRYAIDLGGGRTLTAVTYSVGDLDFEREQRILDRMVETLQFQTA